MFTNCLFSSLKQGEPSQDRETGRALLSEQVWGARSRARHGQMQFQAHSHNSPTTELLLHYIADEAAVVQRDKVTWPAHRAEP